MSDNFRYEGLVGEAVQARERAYVPYSRYPVGAAVMGKSGRSYSGCNVENASYGLTICAERTAIFKAVSEGETGLEALAVVTSNGGTPCGACRQVFCEFASPDAPVVIANAEGKVLETFTVGELLPHGFTPEHLPPR